MEQEVLNKIEEQGKKIEMVYKSVEKMRKYFLWTLIITLLTIVLPLIAIVVLFPWIINTLTAGYGI